jgi:hypothetical protein
VAGESEAIWRCPACGDLVSSGDLWIAVEAKDPSGSGHEQHVERGGAVRFHAWHYRREIGTQVYRLPRT